MITTALNQNQFDADGRAQDIPVTLVPYVRFVGQANSNKIKAKSDVENRAAGLRSDFLLVPFSTLLDNSFSLRSEYLTDSQVSTSILSGELVWEPVLRNPSGFLTAIQGQYFPLGAQGPYLNLDLTGRLRFGHIFDIGDEPSLVANSEYVRVGTRVAAKIGFGGSDILSGLSFSALYWHFNTIYGAGNSIDKFQAIVQYDITENFGFAAKYTKGQDEDKLGRIDQYEAGFIVKF